MTMGALLDEIRANGSIERVILHGYQSSSGPEGEMPIGLSQARADSVARALALEGYPAWRIIALAGGLYPGSADEADACPPPEDDTGHAHRRVDVEVIRCVDQRAYDRNQLGR